VDNVSMPIIIFQGIPETAIMVALALVLTGYEAKLKEVLLILCLLPNCSCNRQN
jgi:hypothetical protein